MRTGLIQAVPCTAVILTAACGVFGPDDFSEQLESNENLWRAVEPVQYRFQYRSECFCPPELLDPAIVEVRQDTIRSVTIVATGGSPQDVALDAWHTINGLFDIVRQAISGGANELEVSYNQQYGYPEVIYVNHSEEDTDGGFGYWVSDLKFLEPPGSPSNLRMNLAVAARAVEWRARRNR